MLGDMTMDIPPEMPSKVSMTVAGSTLITAPVWSQLLADINVVASSVATVCGAIIGVFTVLRFLRAWHADRVHYRQWKKEQRQS